MAETAKRMIAKPMGKVAPFGLNVDEQLEEYKAKIAALEEEKAQREADEQAAEERRKEQETIKHATDVFLEALDKLGISLTSSSATTQTKVVEEQAIEHDGHLSTSNGLKWLIGIFVATLLFFTGYGLYATLNDSELRIFNAAFAHFISHIWLSVGAILSGLGVQFLLFNQQSRYLWSDIDTVHSFQADFYQPTTEGIVRIATCLFTFAFPTWGIVQMFQLILG